MTPESRHRFYTIGLGIGLVAIVMLFARPPQWCVELMLVPGVCLLALFWDALTHKSPPRPDADAGNQRP